MGSPEEPERERHGSPLRRGDLIGGLEVVGFTFDRDRPEAGDIILLKGDDGLDLPPDRPAPEGETEHRGVAPLEELPDGRTSDAFPQMRGVFERMLFDLGVGGETIWMILDDLRKAGHDYWLAGGSVRDPIAVGPAARTNDVDVSGTAGPGALDAVFARVKRRAGGGDYERRISDRLVWSLAPPTARRKRIFEYRPLDLEGFAFEVFGGPLVDDAGRRDLTVNALYWDPQRDLVVDPLGTGLDHLDADPRIMFVLCGTDDPVAIAGLILRCLKFLLRWKRVDVAQVQEWVATLPADLPARIDPDRWKEVRAAWGRCQSKPGEEPVTRDTWIMSATTLGPAAATLVERLLKKDDR